MTCSICIYIYPITNKLNKNIIVHIRYHVYWSILDQFIELWKDKVAVVPGAPHVSFGIAAVVVVCLIVENQKHFCSQKCFSWYL